MCLHICNNDRNSYGKNDMSKLVVGAVFTGDTGRGEPHVCFALAQAGSVLCTVCPRESRTLRDALIEAATLRRTSGRRTLPMPTAISRAGTSTNCQHQPHLVAPSMAMRTSCKGSVVRQSTTTRSSPLAAGHRVIYPDICITDYVWIDQFKGMSPAQGFDASALCFMSECMTRHREAVVQVERQLEALCVHQASR